MLFKVKEQPEVTHIEIRGIGGMLKYFDMISLEIIPCLLCSVRGGVIVVEE